MAAKKRSKKSAARKKTSRKIRIRATSSRGVRKKVSSKPSSILKIAVTLPRPSDGLGLTHFGAAMNAEVIESFRPEAQVRAQAIHHLESLGFIVTAQGRLSFSVRGSKRLFERTFGTKLSTFQVQSSPEGGCSVDSFYFPADEAPWNPPESIANLIDDAYIQWPHIYMNSLFPSNMPSPVPPQVDYHHLRVPGDVNLFLNVSQIHRTGGTGQGVRVAMIDSGFAHGHPYFQRMGYNTTTVLASGATDADLDGNGHGTGESANLLAIAPDVQFIGVKLDNENDPRAGASILEGFQEAISHDPDIISVSLGFDLCPSDPLTGRRTSDTHLDRLPNSLVALEAEIEEAIANGTVVIFSAGNGHVAFPGMMPDVVSAGGVFVDAVGAMQASDYASAFSSKIYPGRKVPDFCGLVGLAQNNADYIMLPIQAGCAIDRDNAVHDGTSTTDGWGVFSGTSAAAPQLAGICALLLAKDPSLTPSQIKQILRLTSIDVIHGNANPASNENNGGIPAGPGQDGATGTGLVDAFAAWRMV